MNPFSYFGFVPGRTSLANIASQAYSRNQQRWSVNAAYILVWVRPYTRYEYEALICICDVTCFDRHVPKRAVACFETECHSPAFACIDFIRRSACYMLVQVTASLFLPTVCFCSPEFINVVILFYR